MEEKKKRATAKKAPVKKKSAAKKIIKKATLKKKLAPKKAIETIEFPMDSAPTNETYSYKGWLNSDSFIKRCMAVIGYNIVGTLMIYGIIIAIALVIGIIVAGIAAAV